MDKQAKDIAVGHPFLLMTLILGEHQCQKYCRLAKEKGLRGGIIILGKGTVKSATLNLLGIKIEKKEIVSILLEKEKATEVLDFFTEELQLHKPGHGIAYTTPVTIAGQLIDDQQSSLNTVQGMEEKRMYKKLTVVVNRGMAEDVMAIARKAGVNGGTIMHGRGTGSEFTAKLFGMEIEPEKELVVMLMPSDIIDKVVNDLHQQLHLDNPGNGILFIESVLEVRGLLDSNRTNKDTE